jgi:hypothetical protein
LVCLPEDLWERDFLEICLRRYVCRGDLNGRFGLKFGSLDSSFLC